MQINVLFLDTRTVERLIPYMKATSVYVVLRYGSFVYHNLANMHL